MKILDVIRERPDLAGYLPLAVTTTASAMAGRRRTHLVSKLLLAPTLAAGVVFTREQRSTARTATLLTALTGSALGDWFMYRSGQAEGPASRVEMRRGARSFAVQQTGLIAVLLGDGALPRAVPSATAASVMAALAVADGQSEAPDPVLIGYGLLLGSMSALAMGEGGDPRQRRAVALGGGLFLLSDAAIILGERFATTPGQRMLASGVVLSTYTAALGLLVHGLRNDPRARTIPPSADSR